MKENNANRLILRGVRIALALMILLPALLVGGTMSVLALAPVQTVHLEGGHTVSFYGDKYNPFLNQTTYFYAVTSGGLEPRQPELSHITLELVCPPQGEGSFVILDAGTWDYPDREALNSGEGHPEPSEFPAMPFREPTTGLIGIKFDQDLLAGETLFFYLTLEGAFPPGPVRFVIKAGQTFPTAFILGPGCTVPGAVTVSSFEVHREDDTLRFKWTTETEINNRGFDLFAVEPNGDGWLRINESLIAPQGLGIEPQEYYYQMERPGLAIGSSFYLRAYDADGTHQDFGPVQAICSAPISQPIVPAPPTERPIMEPRSKPVPLPSSSEGESTTEPPALPIVEPERRIVPGPVIPRLDRDLRPDPIMGRQL